MGLGFAYFFAGKFGLDSLELRFLPTRNGNQSIQCEWDFVFKLSEET